MLNTTSRLGSALSAMLLLQLGVSGAQAGTYWVTKSGRDFAGCGPSSSPCATPAYAVNRAAPGDTWIVGNGTYAGSCSDPNSSMAISISKAGTQSAKITLLAQNKWGAILDGGGRCHSVINLKRGSAWWVIQGFDIRNGYMGGVWSNSGGGKYILLRGNRIHHIGNHYNGSTIGEAGIYTDSSAILNVYGNVIHDVGRTSGGSNSLDHGIYSHGQLSILNNLFYRSLSGWHIQTASDFRGLIANNTFVGPNMFGGGGKQGSIILWQNAGSVRIVNNIFYGQTGAAIKTESFSASDCQIDRNMSSTSSIFDSGSRCTLSSNFTNRNPLFVNPSLSAPDVRLQSGSPAINAGVSVSQAVTDLYNVARPRGGVFDIGATER